MGTNTSKHLKSNFEQNQFSDLGPIKEINLDRVRQISILGSATGENICMVRELNTEDYTQTLSKVDEFLQKMNKTSPFISSFLFITESHHNSNIYSLVFESGRKNLHFQKLLPVFCPVMVCLLRSLEFLESIQLFYPRLHLDSVVETNSNPQRFKLINQFCFTNFLSFITDVYLSDHLSPEKLSGILQQKKEANLNELLSLLSKTISQNPELRQPSHFLSNILFFELYLKQINPKSFTFLKIFKKFEELFDTSQNINKNFTTRMNVPHITSSTTSPPYINPPTHSTPYLII